MSAPRFVIEHREGSAVSVVARELVQLAPLAVRLLAEGKTGDLVVRNAETGHVHVVYPLARATDQLGSPSGWGMLRADPSGSDAA